MKMESEEYMNRKSRHSREAGEVSILILILIIIIIIPTGQESNRGREE